MADSNTTKRALASALKDLMQQIPFQKISVADVCQKCDMNRKSFYYHFRDKYELMNWIFDMDFIKVMDTAPADDPIAALMALGRIMYDNRGFYRNALAVQGQNSLREHIHEILRPLLQERLKEALIDEDSSFYVEFFLDALINTTFYWVSDENCEPPEKFLPHFLSCIVSTSKYILQKYDE